MDNPIIGYISILTNNSIKAKYREIPEEFEHADQLLADIEIEYDGEMPDSMRYFEINECSSPVDLQDLLDKQFKNFKLAVFTNPSARKGEFLKEIKEQVNNSKIELARISSSVHLLHDITLDALINCKIQYCEDTLKLLANEQSDVEIVVPGTHVSAEIVYFFKIDEKFRTSSNSILPLLHKELKKAGYIDCSLREFRRLFFIPGDKIPIESPSPIVWKGTKYNHFAYFIKCINRSFISYSKSPSNNEIAIHLFYKSVEGVYFTSSKGRFDSRLDPVVKSRFDAIMKRIGLLQKTTIQ
jgi:hypothetical protein